VGNHLHEFNNVLAAGVSAVANSLSETNAHLCHQQPASRTAIGIACSQQKCIQQVLHRVQALLTNCTATFE